MTHFKEATRQHIVAYVPAIHQANAVHVARVAADSVDFKVKPSASFVAAAVELAKVGVLTEVERGIYELKPAFR